MPRARKSRRVLAVVGALVALLVQAAGRATGAPAAPVPAVPGSAAGAPNARPLWSFQAPVRPPVPAVRGPSARLVRTPIDAFIAARLADAGLAPSPLADRRTLIRRATFDLHGLPPTPEEVAAFERDRRPDAWSRVIERLLGSPRYGERWARHWLDVAGFAESSGYVTDDPVPRPEAWRYRDYVIRAFNDDKPYDLFLREQLAGDELHDWRGAATLTPRMQEALTATGFLRVTPDATDNQPIFQIDKYWDKLLTTVEVATKATMGLGFNCARCHDHKFDPLSQADYYKVLALFRPALDPARWLPENAKYARPWPLRVLFAAGRDERTRREAELDALATREHALQKQEFALQERGASVKEVEAIGKQRKELVAEMRKVVAADRLWALWDVSPSPEETHVLVRGDYQSPGVVVTPGVPAALDDPRSPFELPAAGPGALTSGRRLAFATWLTRPDHPLTSRVYVNRVWLYHFGRGLVKTPDDFGTQGARPTHPEILDWLARRFVEDGWSSKRLHRLIMTSHVYMQASRARDDARGMDPSNDLWARREPRRLEAEALRDAMLALAGRLDLAMYGPSVPVAKADDGQTAVKEGAPGSERRSVYVKALRDRVLSLLRAFDAPEVTTNEPRRFVSATPNQALALLNNPFVRQMSGALAERLLRERSDEVARLRRAFALVYGRAPGGDEGARLMEAIADEPDRARAWRLLAQSLLASNELLYVD